MHLIRHEPCLGCRRTSPLRLDQHLCRECEEKGRMVVNTCRYCSGRGFNGFIPRWGWLIEEIAWSLFPWILNHVVADCAVCGGDGYAKPPGWPDREEMERLRPVSPPPPPPHRNYYTNKNARAALKIVADHKIKPGRIITTEPGIMRVYPGGI